MKVLRTDRDDWREAWSHRAKELEAVSEMHDVIAGALEMAVGRESATAGKEKGLSFKGQTYR